MSERKHHNSFLLLTTLGVYLGLVLVGAPSGILGNPAAMTRHFDIQDEIEFSERLDNDPDDLFGDGIADLFKDLDKLAKAGDFDWSKAGEFSIENPSFSSTNDTPVYIGFGGLNSVSGKKIEQASLLIARRLLAEKVSSDAGKFHTEWSKTLDFKYKFENSATPLTFSLNTHSTVQAETLAESVDRYLSTVSRDVRSRGRQIIIANTTSKVDDTRVIISTHLARSDIADILA